MLPLVVPVDPAPPEATGWLVDELAKPEYAQARPTLIDLIGEAIARWFNDLFSGTGGAPPVLAIVIGLAVAAAIVVIAVIFGGRVRLTRRVTAERGLLDADERRSARELRADAARAAARGDWVAAIADDYRAIARDAADRELVLVVPGLTARGFAGRAGAAFPDEAPALERCAAAFDGVRYLGGGGTEAEYREVEALARRLAAARPAGVLG
jgi:hypothetical protein